MNFSEIMNQRTCKGRTCSEPKNVDDAQHRRESNSEKNVRGRTSDIGFRNCTKNRKWLENEKSAGSVEHERIDLCYTLNIPEI